MNEKSADLLGRRFDFDKIWFGTFVAGVKMGIQSTVDYTADMEQISLLVLDDLAAHKTVNVIVWAIDPIHATILMSLPNKTLFVAPFLAEGLRFFERWERRMFPKGIVSVSVPVFRRDPEPFRFVPALLIAPNLNLNPVLASLPDVLLAPSVAFTSLSPLHSILLSEKHE
jgi:hypothetical protein